MTDREKDRNAARQLAIIRHAQEVTGNVAKTCRYYGITRQAYYKWLRRYEEGGLEALRDRSSRPHESPTATNAEVIGKIVYLRRSYHFGPHKIAMYLKRYHDIEISPSGIWRILRRLDMSRPPHPSATGATKIDGSATRSLSRDTGSRSTSNSLPRCPGHARSTTSSPRSMIARGSGSLGSTTGSTRRSRSDSWTTSWRSCRSGSR